MKTTKKAQLEKYKLPYDSARIIDNNTLEIICGNVKTIRLHNTDIVVTNTETGASVLNSGGWRTPTTKDRINKYSNAHLYQEAGRWYIGNDLFEDGIVIDRDGKVISGAGKDTSKKDNALLKDIRAYASLYKAPYPMPSAGDCWYCCLRDDKKEPLGDISHHNDHLYAHMDEKYIMGSLIVNAMRESGYNDMQISIVFHSSGDYWNMKRIIVKYLKRRLLPHIAS